MLQAGDALIQLYHNFITEFETKLNLLKVAHFAVIVSRQYAEKEAAIGYLEGVIEKLRATRETRVEEPVLHIKMQIALFKLEQGEQKECTKLLEDGKAILDSMTDIDPSVHASFYWVSSQYHKARQEFAAFYKNALLYLAYTSVDTLSDSFKLVSFVFVCFATSQPCAVFIHILDALLVYCKMVVLLNDFDLFHFMFQKDHPLDKLKCFHDCKIFQYPKLFIKSIITCSSLNVLPICKTLAHLGHT